MTQKKIENFFTLAEPPPQPTEAVASSPDSLYEPLPRRGHSVCEFNKKLYLIGGENIPTSSVDIFDPVTHTWKQEKTKGQAPPSICCSASTVLNQQAFFFGGHSERVDDYNNDLWALNLISLTWNRIPQKDQPPYARYRAGLVGYDDKLILYGGLSRGHAFGDIHLFNPEDGTWTSKHATGTPPPKLIGFTFTQVGQQAVLFGGRQWKEEKKTYVNDVYTLDLEKWHWTKKTTVGTAQPHERYQHAACAIDTTHLLVSGGWDGHEYDDSWILDLQLMRWRKVELPDGGHAVKRSCHAMAAVVTTEGVQILYFGDYVANNDFFATTAVLALQFSYEPAPRWGHSVCEFKKKLYLVGGKDIPTSSIDIFDPATLTWKNKKTEGPTPSSIHCSAFTVLNHKAFFFGGYDDKGACHKELWALDLVSLQWEKISQNDQPPAARCNAGLVGYQDKLILYGGKIGGNSSNSIHVFNLTKRTWIKPQVCGTEPSALSGFTFTRVGHQAVLFGGRKLNGEQEIFEYPNDVYTLDLDKLQWTKKTIASTAQPTAQPCGRYCHAACAIDSVHILVTGGWNGMAIDDLCLLDLQSMEWKEVTLPCSGVERRCHTLATVVTDEGAQILYFGGFIGHDVVAATVLFSSEASLPVMASESTTFKPANKTKQLFTVLSSASIGNTKEWSVVDYITTQQSDQWRERVEQLQQKLGGSEPDTASSEAGLGGGREGSEKRRKGKADTVLGDQPTMQKLLSFKTKKGEEISIPQKIGVNFFNLGIFLLKDKDGAIVTALDRQHHCNAERINKEILSKWLQGEGLQQRTWEELIEVLRKIKLIALAEEIKDSLIDGEKVLEDTHEEIEREMSRTLNGEKVLVDKYAEKEEIEREMSRTLNGEKVLEDTHAEKEIEREMSRTLSDDDVIYVSKYLKKLSMPDLESLGQALGLYLSTIQGHGLTTIKLYCRSIVQDWIHGKDNVKKCGGATWSSLLCALRDKKKNGIADDIELAIKSNKEKAFK